MRVVRDTPIQTGVDDGQALSEAEGRHTHGNVIKVEAHSQFSKAISGVQGVSCLKGSH
jgi:hypothetical protein